MTRRAKISPEDAGLPSGSGNRRVKGLRREEVAVLAGVSTEYYAQIERGDIGRASEEILHALATALRLDDIERQHLLDLSHAAGPRVRRPQQAVRVHANVQQMMDAMPGIPASIHNGRLDLVAANPLGRALYANIYDRYNGPDVPNLASYVFLDEHSQTMFPDWNAVAEDAVATLQAHSARQSRNKSFAQLIGQLSVQSSVFRNLWATHNVSSHLRGKKRIHHPAVGELDLKYEALALPGAAGLQMITFLPEPGSSTDDALRLLGSLIAPDTGTDEIATNNDPSNHEASG